MSQTPDEVSTLAYQWIVQRPDGVGFATTSHDQAQREDALRLEPGADMRPGELVISDDMFGSSLSLEGGLSSTAMSVRDLASGRWSGAMVRLLASDWDQATSPSLLCEGTLGTVKVDGDRLATAVDLAPRAAYQAPCPQTSPECRAILGDRQCGIDMRSRRKRIVVKAVEGDEIIVGTGEHDDFRMGLLRWTSGHWCGLEQLIIEVGNDRLRLHGGIDPAVVAGNRAIISEGCDGRRATCSERFGNILNFRGEPNLPGSDILMRLPGA